MVEYHMIRERTIDGGDGKQSFTVLEMSNEHIKVELLPGLGGKIITFQSLKTGENYLLENSQDLSLPAYGDPFNLQHAYGFDECFPTIEACKYKQKDKQIALPDHGEVWSRPCDYECRDDRIILSILGEKIDYYLNKELIVKGPRLIIRYTLENRTADSFNYIWSSHPLLSIEAGDEILLPREVDNMLVNWASDNILTTLGDQIPWPSLFFGDEKVDWSVIPPHEMNIAVKLYSGSLNKGWAAFYKKRVNESLVYRFDTADEPYLGLWLCYNGWPTDSSAGSYTVALEPANARYDSLEKGIEKGGATKITSNSFHSWQMELRFTTGKMEL